MQNSFQKDALCELCNIASCHAVTSLAEMTGLTINIEVSGRSECNLRLYPAVFTPGQSKRHNIFA